MKDKTTFRDLAVELTDEERLNISRQITDIVIEVDRIENLKSTIKPMREHETILSKIFKDGFETKSVRCRVKFNEPKVGEKTIIRNDTSEQVEVIEMTKSEMQEDLQFSNDDELKILELKENE